MASFGGLLLTNRGRNLQAKAQTGIPLTFKRIAIGDGSLGGASIAELNALINQRKTLDIVKLKILAPGQAIVGCSLSNQDVTSGFYFREIGVFAEDPDIGEILYCYGNSGLTADYIPAGASGGTDIIEKTIDVLTLVGNAQNVTAQINQSLVYETPETAQERIETFLHVSEVPMENQPTGSLWFQIIHPDIGPDSIFISNSVLSDTPPEDENSMWLDTSNTPEVTNENSEGEIIT